MIKQITFVKIINKDSITEQHIVETHELEINPEISLTKQILEYCWNKLPLGFKPQFIG